jgi:lipopolysaccharide/colanic/teichoic acid biosynthesis glycosyltransferase
MVKNNKISSFHKSKTKGMFNIVFGTFGLIFSSPLMLLISIIIKINNHGPVIFTQQRVGKNGKVFTLYKFRSMRVGAEKERGRVKLEQLNEADGPVFKIYNDPRLTKIGAILSKTGLDELPQLINVLKGEMSIVGPRPLPTYEADKLTKNQKVRELVNPGLTSPWVVKGSHDLTFNKWMELDREYVESANIVSDVKIILGTALIVLRSIIQKISQ